MLTVNEQVLIRTKKENYISSIQLVHISAVKLNGIMVIVPGIVLAMVLVFQLKETFLKVSRSTVKTS